MRGQRYSYTLYCSSGWVIERREVLIEIDTLEYQQTEKIETELKDVDRIGANRCTQLCPGSPSGVSHSHNTIYYSFPADSPPSKRKLPDGEFCTG